MGVLACLPLGLPSAYSVLLGGLIFIVPHYYFKRWTLRFHGTHVTEVVRCFYWAEIGKFLLTAALFAAAFIGFPAVNVTALFVMYIAAIGLNVLYLYRFYG